MMEELDLKDKSGLFCTEQCKTYGGPGNDRTLHVKDQDLGRELGDQGNWLRRRTQDCPDGEMDKIDSRKVESDILSCYSIRRRVLVDFDC